MYLIDPATAAVRKSNDCCLRGWQRAAAAASDARSHSILMLASLITLLHFTASAAMNAANSSGEPVIEPSRLGPRNFSRNSASANTRCTSALTLLTTARGVPLGAHRPNQLTASKPDTPLSSTVGTS